MLLLCWKGNEQNINLHVNVLKIFLRIKNTKTYVYRVCVCVVVCGGGRGDTKTEMSNSTMKFLKITIPNWNNTRSNVFVFQLDNFGNLSQKEYIMSFVTLRILSPKSLPIIHFPSVSLAKARISVVVVSRATCWVQLGIFSGPKIHPALVLMAANHCEARWADRHRLNVFYLSEQTHIILISLSEFGRWMNKGEQKICV